MSSPEKPVKRFKNTYGRNFTIVLTITCKINICLYVFSLSLMVAMLQLTLNYRVNKIKQL